MLAAGIFIGFINFFFIDTNRENISFAMNREVPKGAGPDLGGENGGEGDDHNLGNNDEVDQMNRFSSRSIKFIAFGVIFSIFCIFTIYKL
jgi:hypothetical protein